MTDLQTLNVYNPQAVDLARVRRIAQQLRMLQTQLQMLYPGRENIITQMLYAFMTREHMLIEGIYGTGKSDMVNTAFNAFDTTVFGIQLTKFMSEGHVIGLVDPKVARETGAMVNRREGSIRAARFAELDEVLDASPALLRVLLGILNERKFMRGDQDPTVDLHTAIGATNGSAAELIKRSPEMGAVIDRFIFRATVEWLDDQESRLKMYMKALGNQRPTVHVYYDDLFWLSGIVVDGNQITDLDYLRVYDDVLQAYISASGITVSDRRACKLLQLVEAEALLWGQYDVDYDHLSGMKWGLVDGGNQNEIDLFDKVAKPIIDQAKREDAERKTKVDAVHNLLVAYRQNIPTVPRSAHPQELVQLRRTLLDLKDKVGDVFPTSPATKLEKDSVMDSLEKKLVSVQAMIDDRR